MSESNDQVQDQVETVDEAPVEAADQDVTSEESAVEASTGSWRLRHSSSKSSGGVSPLVTTTTGIGSEVMRRKRSRRSSFATVSR